MLTEDRTLYRMIELRRRRNWPFRRGPHPSRMPGCYLWRMPEYIIYFVARCAALLQSDGNSEGEAVQRIDGALRVRILSETQHASTVEQYLELLLAAYYPEYLSYRPSLLKPALALAKAEIGRPNGCIGWPPHEWLSSKMNFQEFEQEFARHLSARKLLVPSSQFEPELAEFVVRRQEGDDLWRFSSPGWTWQAMMGRGGVALVRDGKTIAHVGTIMN